LVEDEFRHDTALDGYYHDAHVANVRTFGFPSRSINQPPSEAMTMVNVADDRVNRTRSGFDGATARWSSFAPGGLECSMLTGELR
jgi:hypothetical protein